MVTQEINMRNLGGRPTKYTDEYIENEAQELEKWMKIDDNIFIEKFCFERNYHEARISEFSKVNKRFSEALDMLKMKQKQVLLEGGLVNKYKYQMCALILGHNHNIVAKTEQKITGSATDPLSFILSQSDVQNKELIHDGKEIELRQEQIDHSSSKAGESVVEAE